jgi:hypothetical protein
MRYRVLQAGLSYCQMIVAPATVWPNGGLLREGTAGGVVRPAHDDVQAEPVAGDGFNVETSGTERGLSHLVFR